MDLFNNVEIKEYFLIDTKKKTIKMMDLRVNNVIIGRVYNMGFRTLKKLIKGFFLYISIQRRKSSKN